MPQYLFKMFTKIIYSLSKRNPEPHPDIVYKTFYISMLIAKEVRCEIELWGSSDAIERLGTICDSVVNVDDVDYKLWDDIKVKIWEETNTPTVDGDIFLYQNPKFGKSLSIDAFIKSDISEKTIRDFNSFNPTAIIPYWDVDNINAFSTGIVNWGDNLDLKKEYVKEYRKLREWYFSKEAEMVEKNEYLSIKYPALSHIICENLMYQFAKHHNLEWTSLETTMKYDHWYGDKKYNNSHKKAGITKLYDMVTKTNKNVIKCYQTLIDSGFKPFLYLPN
jgi:hypothetical protein